MVRHEESEFNRTWRLKIMHYIYGWITRCWFQIHTVWFAICNDVSLWMLAMFHHSDSDNPTTLISITGNVLNEWLLIKNTSVNIDWNEPYYTSDEGLTCNLFMCNLHCCSFHPSINSKSAKSTIFYLELEFYISLSWSFCWVCLVVCICISNQQMRDFAGREFYSSVSKHPEQSQWPSEAGKR